MTPAVHLVSLRVDLWYAQCNPTHSRQSTRIASGVMEHQDRVEEVDTYISMQHRYIHATGQDKKQFDIFQIGPVLQDAIAVLEHIFYIYGSR